MCLCIVVGIDGYSRVLVYRNCSSDNGADTDLSYFQKAVCDYGMPSRVRADRGVENVRVAEFMLTTRGTGRHSFIAGRSVHNQRIEQLWRDVSVAVTGTYKAVFQSLEEQDLLDADNSTDLWCLHYVFMPRIQSSIDGFRHAWCRHRLSTERGRSPLQVRYCLL